MILSRDELCLTPDNMLAAKLTLLNDRVAIQVKVSSKVIFSGEKNQMKIHD